jgi:hypothetical protein
LKIQYKELKKAIDYIEKHGDKAFVNVVARQLGGAFDSISFHFTDMNTDEVELVIFSNPEVFSKITKTERF